ncbi:MAG: efflux RND transporter periplasmic adaptor subunit, partial [Limisphaerales bacterium]
DVLNGKVLVELDSSDIRSRMTQQEIQFQSSIATLTEARQSYEIQKNQNTSTIKAAEQRAHFAKMDLQKFLGEQAFHEVVKLLQLDEMEAAATQIASGDDVERMMLSAMETNDLWIAEELEAKVELQSQSDSALQPAILRKQSAFSKARPFLDFSKYANEKALGDGSAMQQLRRLTDDRTTANQQLMLSRTRLNGTKLLFERGFVTKNELDTEQLAYKNNELRVQTTETAFNLFIKYEFPKQAQELLSRYEEMLRGLEREKKEAISRLAQSKARLKGAESRYTIEANQRREWLDQLDKCIIKAQRPGLVVYGGSNDGFASNEQIREGATVRERQPIITIPDMKQMSVRVKVHESYIQKVRRGLPAKIQVDAFPDRKLSGEVTRVALLPDSQNRWTNPDMKVYQTVISIHGTHDWLKPGMSAKVEIVVNQLEDAIYVPLQAVTEIGGKQFCYVANTRIEMREVEVGDFNDEFIVIKSGLKEGEEVLLRAPDRAPNSGSKTDKKNSVTGPAAPPSTNGAPAEVINPETPTPAAEETPEPTERRKRSGRSSV